MSAQRIPSGDLTLDAVVTGPVDGEVVVLLHGFPQSSWCWRDVSPVLAAAGYRVVAPDLRGYSPDARPPDVVDYGMRALVGDVLAVLDAVGAETAHLVGHDWGAAMAWHTAGRHPERVSTLTAVSVPHPLAFVEALTVDADQRTRSQYMRDWKDPETEKRLLEGDLEAMLAGVPDSGRYLELLRGGALTGGLNYYRAQSRDDLAAVGPITMPTLHVWSDGDLFLGRYGAEATGRYVDGPYTFVELAGVSHWIPEQAAPALSDALLCHLS